jgi:hypothetical protein
VTVEFLEVDRFDFEKIKTKNFKKVWIRAREDGDAGPSTMLEKLTKLVIRALNRASKEANRASEEVDRTSKEAGMDQGKRKGEVGGEVRNPLLPLQSGVTKGERDFRGERRVLFSLT